jgi:hypothetical protein
MIRSLRLRQPECTRLTLSDVCTSPRP